MRWRETTGLLAVAWTLAGCGIDESNFDENLCSGPVLHLLGGISPAEPVDYVELRGVSQVPGEGDFDERELLDVAGLKCASAGDALACAEAFEALPLHSTFSQGDFFSILDVSLAWTRGDEVGAANYQEATLQFLGELDTPEEAALWVGLNQHVLQCDGRENAGTTEGGFFLLTRTGNGCMEDLRENLTFVAADGAIEVVQSRMIERAQSSCP
ncbi:MAG: hypothetical protein H6713_21645 [Myxococcales bacterium]|nr:hypothetical protein [Myxococcales bacterium]